MPELSTFGPLNPVRLLITAVCTQVLLDLPQAVFSARSSYL